MRRSEQLANRRWIPLILGNRNQPTWCWTPTPPGCRRRTERTRAGTAQRRWLSADHPADVNEARDGFGRRGGNGGGGLEDESASDDPAESDPSAQTTASGRHRIQAAPPGTTTRSRAPSASVVTPWAQPGRFKTDPAPSGAGRRGWVPATTPAVPAVRQERAARGHGRGGGRCVHGHGGHVGGGCHRARDSPPHHRLVRGHPRRCTDTRARMGRNS